MVFRIVAVFLIATVCAAQTPMPAPMPAPARTAAGGLTGTITVPQGTTMAMTLISPIKSKTSKPGDSVRAVVAFPVTVGTQVAIPAGTYVDGVLNSVSMRDTQTHMPSVKIHFTALLYPNGYSVPLDAINTQAMLMDPGLVPRPKYELADARDGAPMLGDGFAEPGQTTPTLPPLPSNGPSPGLLIGVTAGASVGILALTLALAHHRGGGDYLLFDNGWQFQMALQSPLTLDASKVAAATSMPVRQ